MRLCLLWSAGSGVMGGVDLVCEAAFRPMTTAMVGCNLRLPDGLRDYDGERRRFKSSNGPMSAHHIETACKDAKP